MSAVIPNIPGGASVGASPDAAADPTTMVAQPGGDPEDAARGLMRQLMQLQMTIDTMARQYPEAGEEFQAMKAAGTAAMTKIVSQRRQKEGAPAPPQPV